MGFTTASQFYKNLFNTKVYKISLDGSCTCPNRDGTKGVGGCIFCSETGSGDFQSKDKSTITAQVEAAKQIVNKKFPKKIEKKYIVYFQNYTNTYGNEDLIIKKWKEALSCSDVVGIAIATRPDCLSSKIVSEIKDLSNNWYVQLEFGLQSKSNETGKLINRCYETKVYENAVTLIKQQCPKVHIVTHLIFGLPGENEKEMMESLDYTIVCGTDGIKITVLYVLKGTKLENMYNDGLFRTLEMEEYLNLIRMAIKKIPSNVIIHRLTGDPPKSLVISPVWTCNKKKVLSEINKILGSN